MVICLEQGADLHMAQLMPLPLTVSCFSKTQIGFTFLLLAHLGSPGQTAVKRVCMCNKCIAVRKVATPLRELTCHTGSHSVTCHPAEVTFPPLPQPKPVLDLVTPEGCKAELTCVCIMCIAASLIEHWRDNGWKSGFDSQL